MTAQEDGKPIRVLDMARRLAQENGTLRDSLTQRDLDIADLTDRIEQLTQAYQDLETKYGKALEAL